MQLKARVINPADVLFIQGLYGRMVGDQIQEGKIQTGGTEGSGVIVAIGEGVVNVRVGQRVYISSPSPVTRIWSEFADVPALYAVPLPDAVDFASGAQLLVNPLTAIGFLEVRLFSYVLWFFFNSCRSDHAKRWTEGRRRVRHFSMRWFVAQSFLSCLQVRADGRKLCSVQDGAAAGAAARAGRTARRVRGAQRSGPSRPCRSGSIRCRCAGRDSRRRCCGAGSCSQRRFARESFVLSFKEFPQVRATFDALGGGQVAASLLGLLAPGSAQYVYGLLTPETLPVSVEAIGDMIFRGTRLEGWYLGIFLSKNGERLPALFGEVLGYLAKGDLVFKSKTFDFQTEWADAVRYTMDGSKQGKTVLASK